MKIPFAVPLIVLALASAAFAQSAPSYQWEAGLGYNYLHTNAPPAACGCFSMNGGTASVGYHLRPSISIVGQFQGITNGNVNNSGHDLTLLTYLVGPRYSYVSGSRLTPFGQVLVGGSHASGGLYSSSSVASSPVNAFAASMGGGLDLRLAPRISVRLVQVDYLLTLLPNGVNSRQNNLSMSTGLVFHIGK